MPTYRIHNYSLPSTTVDTLPVWIQQQSVPPVTSAFNLNPITPSEIKRILKQCSNSATPGEDRITYGMLKKLQSTHHFLATLFSKILLNSSEAPQEWTSATITLLCKKGDRGNPANYCPIALSSCVGKLFHKILAHRLELFLRMNNIIDISAQKGSYPKYLESWNTFSL